MYWVFCKGRWHKFLYWQTDTAAALSLFLHCSVKWVVFSQSYVGEIIPYIHLQQHNQIYISVLDSSVSRKGTVYWKINSVSIQRYLIVYNDSLHWIIAFSLVSSTMLFVTPVHKSLSPRLTFSAHSYGRLWTVAAYLLCYHGIFRQKKLLLWGVSTWIEWTRHI